MIKPAFSNILFYIFIKYLLFYIFMMFKNNDYYLINPGIRDSTDLFYYLWSFLSFPVLISILFSMPIYFSFNIKRLVHFILVNILFLIIEYLLYTYFISQLDLMNGIYNGIIGIILFGVFFYKTIRSKFTEA
ncbi:hypothetical protein IW22_23620 [Chryseobacterium sp. JM1]|nr:hypothetical protein IW22_23620 [Chryseobacterium sp. JM1]